MIWDYFYIFWQVLSTLTFCFYSASFAFYNQTFRSGFNLLLLISHWFLIDIIQIILAIIELLINLAFFNVQAAFRIFFLYTLVGITSLWELNYYKYINISSEKLFKSDHSHTKLSSLIFLFNLLVSLVRKTIYWFDISNNFNLISSTLSLYYKTFNLGF